MRTLKNRNIEEFAVTEDIILRGDTKEPYQYAIETVKDVSQFQDPFHKVDVLVLMRHAIHCCIDKYYENEDKKILLYVLSQFIQRPSNIVYTEQQTIW